MALSGDRIKKGIRQPNKAKQYILRELSQLPRRVYDEYVVTPLRGQYLFDYDWDLAVILDACRYDLATDFVRNNSTKLGVPGKAYSVGAMSPQWIRRTFDSASNSEISNTSYITANVFSDQCPEELQLVDRVWEYAWDSDFETVLPRPVTDRTIELMRENRSNRYIAHYMQPHLPPVRTPNERINGWKPFEGSPGKNRDEGGEWRLAKENENPELVIEAYRNNLEPVIDEVELLLENVTAEKVIITSDHGNYLGEKGRWGHPPYHTHAAVRHVPWWETTATNEETHAPESRKKASTSGSREDKLRALGYLEGATE